MATFRRLTVLVAAVVFVASVGAQTILSTQPGTFVDISATGGTALTAVGDDTAHQITTTIGNAMFPAGPVSIDSNGWALAGTYTATFGHYFNDDIAPSGLPANIPAGSWNGVCLPWWDDLYAYPLPSSTNIWWQELSGILYIMWKDINHYADTTPGAGITFQIQVFPNPGSGPWIQYLYVDTVFGGAFSTLDNGASASIGYLCGALPPGTNAKWSYDTPGAVQAGLVLSLYPPFIASAASPGGAGSIQVDLNGGPANGIYFLALTTTPTTDGWFFGINISFPEIAMELATGWPFFATLDPAGHTQIGPVGGVPSGFSFNAVALAAPQGAGIPTQFSQAFSYTIP
jgi:hypothetical protein